MINLSEIEREYVVDDLRVLTRLLMLLQEHVPGAEPSIHTLAEHARGSLSLLLAQRASFNKEYIHVE